MNVNKGVRGNITLLSWSMEEQIQQVPVWYSKGFFLLSPPLLKICCVQGWCSSCLSTDNIPNGEGACTAQDSGRGRQLWVPSAPHLEESRVSSLCFCPLVSGTQKDPTLTLLCQASAFNWVPWNCLKCNSGCKAYLGMLKRKDRTGSELLGICYKELKG